MTENPAERPGVLELMVLERAVVTRAIPTPGSALH
jgi:hypothetical protein